MKYRREIDGLRAVAVIPVILFHAGFKAFEGGFVGVDVFFVISGYLITTIILSDMSNDKFSIITFYERRARRIMPALFFVMLCCVPFAWFWLPAKHLQNFGQSLAAVSAFSSNILFWLESGYFGTASELKPLLHTWSLAVEEQYYVLFPMLLMALWKFRKRKIFATLLALCATSLIYAHWGAYHYPSSTFFLLPSRAWELAIGALIAFYFLYKKEHAQFIARHKKTSEFFGFSGILLIIYSISAFDQSTPFPSAYALLPTIGTALIIAFSSSETMTGRILGIKPLVGIGLISYSAYLWHQPIFVFARHKGLTESNSFVLLILAALSIALACISWRFIEMPFRDKNKISRKAVFSFTIAGSIVFSSIGLAGHFSDGFIKFKANDLQKTMLSSAISSPKREECHTSGVDYLKPQNACVYHTDNVKWAIFGDSHTVELAYALADELKAYNTGLKHFSFSGCPPIYNNKDRDNSCANWTREAIELIQNEQAIENVVISYRINIYLADDQRGVYPEVPETKEDRVRAEIIQSYKAIIDAFVNSGKTVYLVMQAPELPQDVESIIFAHDSSDKDIKGATLSWWEKRNAYFSSELSRFNREAIIIDPSDFLCDTTDCYAVINGVSMYFDDDHMSLAGAQFVAREIMNKSRLEGNRENKKQETSR